MDFTSHLPYNKELLNLSLKEEISSFKVNQVTDHKIIQNKYNLNH